MSVRKRGQSWQASWTNKAGRRCTRTFRLKQDAEVFEREQRDLVRRGELYDPRSVKTTLADLYPGWYETTAALKPKTQLDYKSLWDNVVQPEWGDRQLRHVNLADVKAWVANCHSKSGKSLGASRSRNAYSLLVQILDHAVDKGLLARNPAREVSPGRRAFLPKSPQGDTRNVLTRAELADVGAAAGPYGDLIRLMGNVGLRFNEAVALKGSDVDFTNNVIRVERTFSDLNGKLIEQLPKNGSTRQVPLPASLRQSLAERALKAGQAGYLFTTETGACIRHSNFSRRVWTPALKEAGIVRRVTIHDLRHTAASWLVANRCSVPLLAKMLGHADPALTLRRYSHLFEDDIQRLAASIDAAETA